MSIGFQIAIGVGASYLAATLSESYLHRVFGHASPRLRRLWARHPRWFGHLTRLHYRHAVVHHGLTFLPDHVTQFLDEQDKARVDAVVSSRGDPHIEAERYGLSIGPRGLLTYNVTLLPILLALYWFCGPFACAGGLPVLLAAPMLAMFVHPYLHLDQAEAQRLAPRPLAALLRTRYFRTLARHHYLHHVYQRTNFNLLMGGDWLLLTHRRASPDDLKAMAKLGIPTHGAFGEALR